MSGVKGGPSGPPTPLVGASEEVIAHHAAAHPCADASVAHVLCPCGRCVALVCRQCEQAVFVAVAPIEGSPCVHATKLRGPHRS